MNFSLVMYMQIKKAHAASSSTMFATVHQYTSTPCKATECNTDCKSIKRSSSL